VDALVKARPIMIATLDSFRDTLEDLGGGLGVTDPVSGPVVLALKLVPATKYPVRPLWGQSHIGRNAQNDVNDLKQTSPNPVCCGAQRPFDAKGRQLLRRVTCRRASGGRPAAHSSRWGRWEAHHALSQTQ
jgi:hypothetical protein